MFIDDVWSGGTAEDGDWPLLSEAIGQGLYHPRCHDSHTTYFPELEEEAPLTEAEERRQSDAYAAGQRETNAQRQAEKWRRLERYALDGGNRRTYQARAEGWEASTQKSAEMITGKVEAGRLARIQQQRTEKETLFRLLESSVTVGSPYIEPELITSLDFSKKFSGLTGNSKTNDKLRRLARGNLTRNNGTYTETLCIVDADTGELVLQKRGEKNALEVILTAEERSKIRRYPGRIIGMHNHPTNILPTGSDFVTAAARGYEFGIVITHDGKVFKYTGPTVVVKPEVLDVIIDKYTRLVYTEDEKIDAFKRALDELERRYGITWSEM